MAIVIEANYKLPWSRLGKSSEGLEITHTAFQQNFLAPGRTSGAPQSCMPSLPLIADFRFHWDVLLHERALEYCKYIHDQLSQKLLYMLLFYRNLVRDLHHCDSAFGSGAASKVLA